MDNINKSFNSEIDFLDNILLIDSIEDTKKKYTMAVDYLKEQEHYILTLNLLNDNKELLNASRPIKNKVSGSIIIKNIIELFTDKYMQDITIDVKELDSNKNCIKFGRRVYNSKK